MSPGIAHSVHVRLVQHSKAMGVDPNLVLVRYATERLLYRLSRSPHGEQFVLKGGLLLLVWLGEATRPTRDVDLLGLGDVSTEALASTFSEICAMDVEPDGLTFDADTIRIAPIRREDPYGGQRLTMLVRLGPARLRVQVDVGIGDAVTPEPEWLEYPSLLDLPRPRVRAYRPESMIAEKTHALVVLGSKNTRMRDFFDIHALAMNRTFQGTTLARALRTTFERRGTDLPTGAPLALTPAFAEVDGKRAQWAGFRRRSQITTPPADIEVVIEGLAVFLGPVLAATARDKGFTRTWLPGGPWRAAR